MATATATPEDPIVAIYPVPGEIDPGDKGVAPLAPIPVRLERADAEKAVKRGAFSFVDASLEEREAAAKAARSTAPAPAASGSKSDIAAAVKAALAEQSKATNDRIAELEAKLAAATPAEPDK